MSREFALALDLGTTGVRALVVAADGAVRSRAYRPLTTRYPAAGCVEQDPLEMWERSLVVLREALRAAGLGARDVAALGVASQRATALAWEDGSGRPLAPAIGWQDARGAEIAAQYRARGVPLASLSSVTKFLWWLRRDPAVRAAASAGVLRLGNPDAWLTERLTAGAAHVTDPGHASCTALYDLRRGDWSHAALELFELEERFLPRVVATSGIVDETDAKLLGAPVAVAAHAGDQQAACFAQGVHSAGDAKLTLGTSAMLDLHTGAAPCEPGPGAFPLALWRLSDARDAFCLEGNVIRARS